MKFYMGQDQEISARDRYAQNRGFSTWEEYQAYRLSEQGQAQQAELEKTAGGGNIYSQQIPIEPEPQYTPEQEAAMRLVSAQETAAYEEATAPEDIQAHEYYSMMPTSQEIVEAAKEGEIGPVRKDVAKHLFEQTGEAIPWYEPEPQPWEKPADAGQYALPVLLGVGIFTAFLS